MEMNESSALPNGVIITRQRVGTSADRARPSTRTIISLAGSKIYSPWLVAIFFPIGLALLVYAAHADTFDRNFALLFGACALAVGLHCAARYAASLTVTIDENTVVVTHGAFRRLRVARSEVHSVSKRHKGPYGEHELSTFEVALIAQGRELKIINASNYGNLGAVEEFADALTREVPSGSERRPDADLEVET
jgi:hypothetical protein